MTSPLNNLTDTWNNSGTVFTGLKYNITNTASAAGSMLMDLQIGAASQFKVLIPAVPVEVGGSSNNLIRNSSGSGFRTLTGTFLTAVDNTVDIAMFYSGQGITIGNAFNFSWSSSSAPNGTPDLNLFRDAAGIFAQRNSTSAQTFCVYNTYTDSSNYERAAIQWSSNILTFGPQILGTGQNRVVQYGLYSNLGAGKIIGDISNFGVILNSGGNALWVASVSDIRMAANTVLSWTGTSGDAVAGADTKIQRGAAGILQFGSSQSFSANASVATVLGSVGPSGANTTVQKWLTIKDDGGTTRYIPCF